MQALIIASLFLALSGQGDPRDLAGEPWAAVVPSHPDYWPSAGAFWWAPAARVLGPNDQRPEDELVVPVLQVELDTPGHKIARYRFNCQDSAMIQFEIVTYDEAGAERERSEEAVDLWAMPHSAEAEVYRRICDRPMPGASGPARADSLQDAVNQSRRRGA